MNQLKTPNHAFSSIRTLNPYTQKELPILIDENLGSLAKGVCFQRLGEGTAVNSWPPYAQWPSLAAAEWGRPNPGWWRPATKQGSPGSPSNASAPSTPEGHLDVCLPVRLFPITPSIENYEFPPRQGPLCPVTSITHCGCHSVFGEWTMQLMQFINHSCNQCNR